MKKIVSLFALVLCLGVQQANAANIGQSELVSILKTSKAFSTSQITKTVAQIKDASPNKKIELSDVLYTSGFNASFFRDTDDLEFDIAYKDAATGNLMQKQNAVSATFRNGGFKMGIAYRWLWIQIPAGMIADQLKGAEFGRGVGVTVDAALGVDISVMPGRNRPGTAFAISPQLGLAGGIMLPKLEINNVSLP